MSAVRRAGADPEPHRAGTRKALPAEAAENVAGRSARGQDVPFVRGVETLPQPDTARRRKLLAAECAEVFSGRRTFATQGVFLAGAVHAGPQPDGPRGGEGLPAIAAHAFARTAISSGEGMFVIGAVHAVPQPHGACARKSFPAGLADEFAVPARNGDVVPASGILTVSQPGGGGIMKLLSAILAVKFLSRAGIDRPSGQNNDGCKKQKRSHDILHTVQIIRTATIPGRFFLRT